MTEINNKEIEQLYDELYEKYGKPLERQHTGEYLAVSRDGRTVLGRNLVELTDEAVETLGPGNFVYKIGEKAVGQWL